MKSGLPAFCTVVLLLTACSPQQDDKKPEGTGLDSRIVDNVAVPDTAPEPTNNSIEAATTVANVPSDDMDPPSGGARCAPRHGQQRPHRCTGTCTTPAPTARRLNGVQGIVAPASKTVNLYVLPGATGTIRMPAAKPAAVGTALQLAVESDQITFNASVRVGAQEGVAGHP